MITWRAHFNCLSVGRRPFRNSTGSQIDVEGLLRADNASVRRVACYNLLAALLYVNQLVGAEESCRCIRTPRLSAIVVDELLNSLLVFIVHDCRTSSPDVSGASLKGQP
jgi:hypothetical protein